MKKGSAAFEASGWTAKQEQKVRALLLVLGLSEYDAGDVIAVGKVVERMTRRV